jgi:hydrogenase expression/formation protein HypD
MKSEMENARNWLERIRALPIDQPVRVRNVCGGHERTIAMAGLRSALPPSIELIAGPGCPVCVCPEEDIYDAIALSQKTGVTVVAFGDMLRVPANVPKSQPRSLDQARALGGRVRPIASPMEAARIAREEPNQEIVFFAAGFETTTAPVAGLLAQELPPNLSVLLSGRLTWPAVAMLLDSDSPGFDALVAPGHVSAVMGPEEWSFVSQRHRLPTAIGGFTAEGLLSALHAVIVQHIEGRAELENRYQKVVRPGGNPTARRVLAETMDVTDANWRGIGIIPRSGFAIKDEIACYDARERFDLQSDNGRKRAGEMPPGCDCARVVLGKIKPHECRLYGEACTPRDPIGPCMVSDEGACHIWWTSGVRERAATMAPAPSDTDGARRGQAPRVAVRQTTYQKTSA